MVDAQRCWDLVTAERLSLADLLDELTDAAWEEPSLCAGWRVRDVVSHLILGASPPSWASRTWWGLRSAGRFHTLNHDVAVHYAARPPSELVADLRRHAASRRLPVPLVVNHLTTLQDVLIHGQDIAVPLGLERPMPLDGAAAAATKVWTMGWPFWARRKLRGLHFTATDTTWSAGSGPSVDGPIAAILLVLAGRPAGIRHLSGDGVEDLSARLAR